MIGATFIIGGTILIAAALISWALLSVSTEIQRCERALYVIHRDLESEQQHKITQGQ